MSDLFEDDRDGSDSSKSPSRKNSEGGTKFGGACSEKQKQDAAKLIEEYYYQLTQGCGNPDCSNKECATGRQNSNLEALPANEAAVQALHLLMTAPNPSSLLCKKQTRKLSILGHNHVKSLPCDMEEGEESRASANNCYSAARNFQHMAFSEESLKKILEECEKEGNYSQLVRTVGQVFSDPDILFELFLKKDGEETDGCKVDLDSARKVFRLLDSVSHQHFSSSLINALLLLSEEVELKFHCSQSDSLDYVNVLLVVFELPMLWTTSALEALPALCKALYVVPIKGQALLARVWSKTEPAFIHRMLLALQSLITDLILQPKSGGDIQEKMEISYPIHFMKILYYSSIVGGKHDGPECRRVASDSHTSLSLLSESIVKDPESAVSLDPLEHELGVRPVDARKPLIPFNEFYNEPLSEEFRMFLDGNSGGFSLMDYAFVLTLSAKALGLYFENRVRMQAERRMCLFQTALLGEPSVPYLKLKVRRDHIIDDALVELEMVALQRPLDLRKQLMVEFVGEEGVDEGGLSKEFFLLLTERLFNPDFGMFALNEETHTYWFNPTCFESDAQFSLFGILMGLALYNSAILAVQFPLVLYRKLMGQLGTFDDLEDFSPMLYRSLCDVLAYEGADIEDVFMQSFQISYTDVFGNTMTHELKPGGEKVILTQENKQEFVSLYADFLLNKSVSRQYSAFERGFLLATSDSSIQKLFRPEELERLICGERDFDLEAMEESTDYDGGYSPDSPVIKYFWSVVHEMSESQKKDLLQFTTGSDRVPVGGLKNLRFIIAYNGPDSDRLPTAHTCFNALLLPEYSSREKLKERLLKAISHAKGFGML